MWRKLSKLLTALAAQQVANSLRSHITGVSEGKRSRGCWIYHRTSCRMKGCRYYLLSITYTDVKLPSDASQTPRTPFRFGCGALFQPHALFFWQYQKISLKCSSQKGCFASRRMFHPTCCLCKKSRTRSSVGYVYVRIDSRRQRGMKKHIFRITSSWHISLQISSHRREMKNADPASRSAFVEAADVVAVVDSWRSRVCLGCLSCLSASATRWAPK